MAAIRNSAKALIIRDGCLLAMRMRDEDGSTFFILPGGGQEPGETLAEAARRECAEELGVEVVVHELCYVREFLDDRPHRVEFIFRCTLMAEPDGTATRPDVGQLGIAWLPLAQLPRTMFYPLGLRALLANTNQNCNPIYLGNLP
ncbi:MAG: NUDIX domain-containing protein [Thermomicrobiales bacterium]